ncbi:MAG TPA: type II toxin-antitoxin system HigB family toxin, partial [Thermoanaerobaculia bacterium]|nr:type II toxin-antitoxin system HigB family toxin [Thermoanaerobaculia bacterium]
MRVIALSTLKAFWETNPGCAEVKDPVLAWYRHTVNADWA